MQHIQNGFPKMRIQRLTPRLNIGRALDAPLRLIADWDEETRNGKIFETHYLW